MTKPTKIVINCATGVQEIIELTQDELSELEASRVRAEAERIAKEAAEQARATAKAELLDRLGISEEEAKLLLS
jgi:hypothetical protein